MAEDAVDVADVAVLVKEEEAEVKIYLFFKFHKFIIYLLFRKRRW